MDIKTLAMKDIKPYEKNPRKNDAAVDKVAASIKEFGFQQPIVIDGNGVIIVGHTRYRAAQILGIETVPVVVASGLSDTQVKAYRLADNKTAEFAEWDAGLLGGELADIASCDFSMEPFGFVSECADEIQEDDFDVDAAIPETPTTKRGDVWLLGGHRLVCGDSTVRQDVDVLMSGGTADMVFTDPPYNVDYTGSTADSLKIINDKMSAEKFYMFLRDAFLNMINVTVPGGAVYICHADSEGLNFRMALRDSGWLLKQCIVWVKNALVMGRQDHHWQHEPILYGWKPGAAHKWYGGRKQSTVIKPDDGVFVNKTPGGHQLTFNNGSQKVVLNVPSFDVVSVCSDEITTTWHINKPLRNGEHPTMKPIKLCARAISNSSVDGGLVLDLFGGSGSTLIASEQMGRRCYCMELDPKYCDVIIKRWEQHTGKCAERIGG